MVRQLQHEKRLVPHDLAYRHRQLESVKWEHLDGSLRRGRRKNHEARIPAGEHHRAVLRKCCSSAGSFAMGPAVTVCVAVSQTDQGAREGVTGAKTEADESGAAAKAVNANIGPAAPAGVP